MSHIFSQFELAGLLGVHRSTVSNWLAQGCPFVQQGSRGQGKEWKLSLPDVVAWLRKKDVEQAIGDTSKLDIDEARRRKTAAEAALAELELSRQRGEVVSISVVAEVVGEQLASCRARLLSMPTKCAPLVAPLDDVTECRDVLELVVREACDELVGYAGSDDSAEGAAAAGDPQADSGEDAPAAEANSLGVVGPVPKTQRRGKRGAGAVDHSPQ